MRAKRYTPCILNTIPNRKVKDTINNKNKLYTQRSFFSHRFVCRSLLASQNLFRGSLQMQKKPRLFAKEKIYHKSKFCVISFKSFQEIDTFNKHLSSAETQQQIFFLNEIHIYETYLQSTEGFISGSLPVQEVTFRSCNGKTCINKQIFKKNRIPTTKDV